MATGMPPGMPLKLARRSVRNDDAVNDARAPNHILIYHSLIHMIMPTWLEFPGDSSVPADADVSQEQLFQQAEAFLDSLWWARICRSRGGGGCRVPG